VAQKVVEALRPPFDVLGVTVAVRASVGLTSVGPDARTPSADELLGQADTAMYAAKRAGKDALRLFEPGMAADCLSRHGLTGRALVLEVTESGLLSDPDAAREVCGQLRTQGIHLALDDFGVGYSSLAHLHALPLDSLKVDRAFVDLVDRDEDQRRFTRAVLRLGEDLGLAVIAEGVERTTQLDVLSAMGCSYVQGYLLTRPVPAAELAPLLSRPLLPVVAPIG